MSLIHTLQQLLAPAPPRRQPRRRRSSAHECRQRTSSHQPPRPRTSSQSVVAYHGTKSDDNARSILAHGWQIGSGNGYGDGVYFSTNEREAKGYAGSAGVYLKCRIHLGKTITWDKAAAAEYRAWCRDRGAAQNNSALTAYLVQRGYTTLRHKTIIVALAPQYANAAAWKQRFRCIRIMSVHRASNDQRIWV